MRREIYIREQKNHDTRMAILASTIVNVNTSKKSKRVRPEDFMPKYHGERPAKQLPPETLHTKFLAAFGRKINGH